MMGANVSTPPPGPTPPPVVAPPPEPPPPAPKPVPFEQRCIACINYHHHDHPSVQVDGANFQQYFYPEDSDRKEYNGILIKNLPEWFGRLVFRSGAQYEGGFRAGEFNGFGHYVVENKYEYLGGWNDGKKEGFGREIFVSEVGLREEYVGGWKDNLRHGEGLKNGREWVRYYMGNQLHGFGNY